MRVWSTAVALSFAMVGAASASDLAVRAPRPAAPAPYLAPAPVITWSGFYFGANGGYGWGDSHFDSPGFIGFPAFTGNTFHPDGGFFGGTFGFNLQGGPWVGGLETDLDASWIKGTSSAFGICAGCSLKNRWYGTLRLRGGYDFNGLLLYATGGLAYGGIRVNGPFGGEAEHSEAGWTAGGGLEYAFDQTWSGKVEYLYMDLGHTGFGALETHFKENLFRVGLNARFSQLGWW